MMLSSNAQLQLLLSHPLQAEAHPDIPFPSDKQNRVAQLIAKVSL